MKCYDWSVWVHWCHCIVIKPVLRLLTVLWHHLHISDAAFLNNMVLWVTRLVNYLLTFTNLIFNLLIFLSEEKLSFVTEKWRNLWGEKENNNIIEKWDCLVQISHWYSLTMNCSPGVAFFFISLRDVACTPVYFLMINPFTVAGLWPSIHL